ncbi:hypothetical protein DSO57_1010596 [Entomophthora muscae]|uniref:Uncharacterized protein n=1 Tax=Entomophthora muscae TaxID=34485 RepID=A0ACC2USB7_9FUNG|nr:hypothetical protein DSO57_1010596 [Entomophthora muscae]
MKSFIEISLIAALVQGGYIVTLKSSTRGNATEAHLDQVRLLFGSGHRSSGSNEVKHVYSAVFQGYSAEFTQDVLFKVKAMKEVDAVEEDQLGKGDAIQRNSPWGLARLSSATRLPDNSQLWSYNYDPSAGDGIDVFVVDSGIKIDHPDFQGRALWGANFINSVNLDEHGHGTHVAGTVGSTTYGVAKSSTVIAVKVLDAQNRGTVSGFIAGVDWAIRNKRNGRGCVMNLSLVSGRSDAFNSAVRAAVNSGCVVAACAGNDNMDACNASPASEPSAITVGASNFYDLRAGFSNWGRCLDVFAPGENILSLSNKGGARYDSGTSMASPHVAGLAANVMSKTRNYNPGYVAQSIINLSKRNVLANVGSGSPNLLASNIGLV